MRASIEYPGLNRCLPSVCVALFLVGVLAGCRDDDADTPIAQGNLDLLGKWDGTRFAHPFLLVFTNTDVVWDFASAVSTPDMSGDIVCYDNSADFGVILWQEPSALAGKYQKFSWGMIPKYEALLVLYDEKDTLSEAMDDTVMKCGPFLLTKNVYSGCHCHEEDGHPP